MNSVYQLFSVIGCLLLYIVIISLCYLYIVMLLLKAIGLVSFISIGRVFATQHFCVHYFAK